MPAYVSLDEHIKTIHEETARKIWPRGTLLQCPRCQRVQPATVGEIAEFFAHGWPLCHGRAMRIGRGASD